MNKVFIIEAHRLQYTEEELQKLVKETYDSLQKEEWTCSTFYFAYLENL